LVQRFEKQAIEITPDPVMGLRSSFVGEIPVNKSAQQMVLEKLLDYEDRFFTFFEEPKVLAKKALDGQTMLAKVVSMIGNDIDKELEVLNIGTKMEEPDDPLQ
jgi:hypothetical protein